jgi:hypothetical protein
MTDKQRYHYERWKLLISDRMQSGMSTIEWCASRGVTKDAYYYWMNKFRKENVDTAIQNLPAQISKTSAFVELKRSAADIASNYSTEQTFQLPAAVIRQEGFSVEIYQNASAEMIRALIEGVRNVQA